MLGFARMPQVIHPATRSLPGHLWRYRLDESSVRKHGLAFRADDRRDMRGRGVTRGGDDGTVPEGCFPRWVLYLRLPLGFHLGEAATAAGVGARGCFRSVRLVVQAAYVRDSPGIAEDARGDPFPAKLALIAERGDALRARREGGQLTFSRASSSIAVSQCTRLAPMAV